MRTTRIMQRSLIIVATSLACCVFAQDVLAQTDIVNMVSGPRIRGTIVSSTPDQIVVNTDDGNKNVASWDVRLIRFEGSNELVKAKSAYGDDRFSACYDQLNSLGSLDRDLMQQDADFYKAMSAARISLRGGKVTMDQAATLLRQFMQSHPNSFHTYEVMDMFGDLAIATGRFDAAETQFAKTAACSWPEISFNGTLKAGKAQLYSGKYDEAIASFKATERDDNGEAYAVQAKLVARCLRAQALGLSGKTAGGMENANSIIKNENSKNIDLFAHAYNALGTCYAKENKNKEAIRAFLHTDLLFTIEPDSHAQALYNLVELWAATERPDRAARARQKLTERYRNTFWAAKLNN